MGIAIGIALGVIFGNSDIAATAAGASVSNWATESGGAWKTESGGVWKTEA